MACAQRCSGRGLPVLLGRTRSGPERLRFARSVGTLPAKDAVVHPDSVPDACQQLPAQQASASVLANMCEKNLCSDASRVNQLCRRIRNTLENAEAEKTDAEQQTREILKDT